MRPLLAVALVLAAAVSATRPAADVGAGALLAAREPIAVASCFVGDSGP